MKITDRKRLIISMVAAALVLISILLVVLIRTSSATHELPAVVVRIDDIQDFAFKDAQLFLLNESRLDQMPVSLAVIPAAFGSDNITVDSVKQSISLGSEIAAHGWKHEDLALLSQSEQSALLWQSKERLKAVLNVDTRILIPPFYSSNRDTLEAMKTQGYSIISTLASLAQPAPDAVLTSIPATVELSIYANGAWQMKSCDTAMSEVMISIRQYGFAVVITHPQEFLVNGKLDPSREQIYRSLVAALKADYGCQTLSHLAATAYK